MSTAPGMPMTLPTSSSGRPILARGDLEVYDPRFVRSGGRERFFCPIHGGDHQRSLSVDPTTGHYTCHACKAKGTLRDHWTDGSSRPATRRAPSLEEIGRQVLAMRERTEIARAERLAGDLPPEASAFLAKLGTFVEALRESGSLGAAYLRRRGLDPSCAAALGVGYSAPNMWPGDRGRRVGRVVYPLADPATGRVVSAVGRLCVDANPAWSEDLRERFKAVKQRKLRGCPAGVWPYTSVDTARARRRPLALVEGPADALALLQRGSLPCEVLALVGTADVLTSAAIRGVAGVIVALDSDMAGAKASLSLRGDLALAGARYESTPSTWLGLAGAKDPADLAALTMLDRAAADACYAQALGDLAAASDRLTGAAWDDAAATALLTAMYERCGDACARLPASSRPWPSLSDAHEDAIDGAFGARDWRGLERAIEACESEFRDRLSAMAMG